MTNIEQKIAELDATFKVKSIKTELEKDFFSYSTHKDAPSCIILDIIKRTEKAIQVKNTALDSTCWIPKSALQVDNCGISLTLKAWFKKLIETNYYQKRTLLLIS